MGKINVMKSEAYLCVVFNGVNGTGNKNNKNIPVFNHLIT